MSQIVGRKLPQASIPAENFTAVAVEKTDHLGNAAMQTMIFGSGNRSRQITVGNTTYIGEAAPGSLYTEPKWRITRLVINVPGPGIDADIETTHAYVPAAGAVPARYSGFEHIFNNYATLVYA